MSPAARVGDELAGEDELEADVVGERGEHGRVVDQAAGRQRAAPRRSGEQRGERGRVGGAAAVAEREQPPAGGERAGHRVGGGAELDSATARERRRPQRDAVRRLGHRRARRGRRAARPASRSSPSMNGYRKSVPSGIGRLTPTQRRWPCRRARARGRPGARGADEGRVDDVSSPSAVRTEAAVGIRNASRPRRAGPRRSR